MSRSLASLVVALLVSPVVSAQVFTSEPAFLGALPPCNFPTSVQFDNLPHNTKLFGQYSGVEFGGTARTWNAASFGGGGTFHSSPNVLTNYSPAPTIIRFTAPVVGVGFYNPSLYDNVEVRYFGACDVLLHTEVMPSWGAGITYRGYINASSPIFRVEAKCVEPQTSDTFFLDDMKFACVPNPPGWAFCFGDGSLPTPCPCIPPLVPSGAADSGCANSFNPNGARLDALGTTSPDTVTLNAFIATGYVGFAVMLKGNGVTLGGVANNDGVLCVSGTIIRFGAHYAGGNCEPAGYWSYPNAVQTTPLSVATAQAPGQPAFYQLFYRNSVPFCTSATLNWTNGYRIDW